MKDEHHNEPPKKETEIKEESKLEENKYDHYDREEKSNKADDYVQSEVQAECDNYDHVDEEVGD